MLSNEAAKSLIQFTSYGYIHNSSLRMFCHQFLGDDADLSAQTLINIRKRCIYLAKKYPNFISVGMPSNELKRLGNDLDAEEEQAFQKMTGIAATCIEVRRQILHDTGSGWKVTKMLEELKGRTIGFDYRINFDALNRPIGVCWITNNMRNNWVRYGDLLFLDCKKKDLNRLYWPYIGPAIITNENKVGLVVESLCVEESEACYSFVLKSLQDMEPKRKLTSIKVIFSDGFLTSSFATKLNLHNTIMFLDSYHLMNCIFPEAMGERAFNLVKAQLNEMVFCHDEGKYRDAFKEIAEKLYHMPDKLACIEKRYQNPATFAQFALLSVRGSMRKRGSAHAEQNHSICKS